jgi:hypothetical protein
MTKIRKVAINKITLSRERRAIEVSGLFRPKPGAWVAIRTCEPSETDTYLGLFLGGVATGFTTAITDDAMELQFSSHNPAIYVPELNRIVFGYESWWGEIKSPEDMRKITNKDIENIWYVRALKELQEKP